MKLIEAITKCIADNKCMSPGYIGTEVHKTIERFLAHNLQTRLTPAAEKEVNECIQQDHMP